MYLSLSFQTSYLADERVEGIVHEVPERGRRLEKRTAELRRQRLAFLCRHLRAISILFQVFNGHYF